MFRAISLQVVAISALAVAGTCRALDVVVDYSDDAAAMNFFAQRPLAKAAVEAAAADLSALLAPTRLTALGPTGSPNVDAISGINASTTVTADWDFLYTNPATGVEVTIASPSLAVDVVRVFVGMNGTNLGEGGPGSASVGLSASGFESELVGATNAMQAASNTYMNRGGGPVIGTLAGSIDWGSTSAPFALTFGPALGTAIFNNDIDNNGSPDSLSALDAFWHYDHTTPVVAGKNDFYSVALHEMLHVLGVGGSDTWTGLVSGTTWLGANVQALNGGSGAGLVDPSGQHLTPGLMSTNIGSGLAQEVAMDPSLTTGTRKGLTAMDVAFLDDLGYEVAPVPEPGSMLLLGAALAGFVLRRQRGKSLDRSQPILPMRPGQGERHTHDSYRHGAFKSLEDLIEAIDDYIETDNRDSKPFVWTAGADMILGRVERLCKRIHRSPREGRPRIPLEPP